MHQEKEGKSAITKIFSVQWIFYCLSFLFFWLRALGNKLYFMILIASPFSAIICWRFHFIYLKYLTLLLLVVVLQQRKASKWVDLVTRTMVIHVTKSGKSHQLQLNQANYCNSLFRLLYWSSLIDKIFKSN